MSSSERLLGLLVVTVVGAHVASLASGTSRARPVPHTLGVVVGYAVLVPYVLRTSPHWYGLPMQLMVAGTVTVLDWFALHQDLTRFSEAQMCLLGNCRENARITGHMAHLADVATVGFLLVPAVQEDSTLRNATLVALGAYALAGSKGIEDLTKPGSASDLRHLTRDADKCRQARIMRSHWRGGLNDVVTVLGLVAAWQTIVRCGDGACTTGHLFPLNQLKRAFVPGKVGAFAVGKVVFDVVNACVPTYLNYVNASYQHGRMSARDYGLPDCYDDP
tara:strand:- start:1992 stop:2819 length:828 start_codon:yes stop_codon:yes gene_type:complete